MKMVVDTNVAVVANGRNTHAKLDCQINCIEFLEKATSKESRIKLILDVDGLIIGEYRNHLKFSGQPGVGDAFFKFLHDHMHLRKKVQLVSITKIDNEQQGYAELPRNQLDPSDRKFLAVAVKTRARIVNAVDADWHQQIELTKSLGISVLQLCPKQGTK